MDIKDKIYMDREDLENEGPITIVALGDSVTHGALGGDEINYETVYWNLLRKKILDVRNYVPVNVINAAIGGTSAIDAVKRLDNQVLNHNPDLVIVCFGLNDVNGTLENYLSSLKIIFEKCSASGTDVIFMTPNMLNTYVSEDTEQRYMKYAAVTADFQNSGRMDLYISSAVNLALEMGITVCDCYSEWKKLSETEDITMLLSNRINHPTPQMHNLFADMLFEIIFDNTQEKVSTESTMYNN